MTEDDRARDLRAELDELFLALAARHKGDLKKILVGLDVALKERPDLKEALVRNYVEKLYADELKKRAN
jgi:hypothetical protein